MVLLLFAIQRRDLLVKVFDKNLCVPLLSVSIFWSLSYFVVFNFIFLLVIVSYFRTIATKSYVPKHIDHHQSISLVDSLSKIDIESLPKCERCDKPKPHRAHHCSVCKQCVLKMDHHCPWVNNCVGWNNYKFFILFITYTCILCFVGTFMTIPYVIIFWHDITLLYAKVLILGATAIGIMFFFTLVGFVLMHYQLALRNETTLESLVNLSANPWDKGKRANWEEVFGSKPFLWFLPVNTLVHNGCNFPPLNTDENSRIEREVDV